MPNKLLFNWSTYQERDREGGINNEERNEWIDKKKKKAGKKKTKNEKLFLILLNLGH